MSKSAFEKIKAGVEDVRTYLDETADTLRYRVHEPNTVRHPEVRARNARASKDDGESCSSLKK